MLQYIDDIVLPYVKQKRKEDVQMIKVFDRFKAQCTVTVLSILEENNILVALQIALTGSSH